MKTKQFQTGDFCFCEFELKQIKSMKDGRVTSTSCGLSCLSSYDLSDRCFPLSLPIKIISDVVGSYRNDIFKLKNTSLNYPDINRHFIEKWAEMCECIEDNNKVAAIMNEVTKFYNGIMDMEKENKSKVLNGVLIYRN